MESFTTSSIFLLAFMLFSTPFQPSFVKYGLTFLENVSR